jgi:hypothetical protein
MLLGAGEVEAAAQLLTEADPRQIERIEVLELLSVLERIEAAHQAGHRRARDAAKRHDDKSRTIMITLRYA